MAGGSGAGTEEKEGTGDRRTGTDRGRQAWQWWQAGTASLLCVGSPYPLLASCCVFCAGPFSPSFLLLAVDKDTACMCAALRFLYPNLISLEGQVRHETGKGQEEGDRAGHGHITWPFSAPLHT